MAQQLTPGQFIAKWSRAELSERAASQSHFNDLCELLGQPTPTDHDGTGVEYTFEKGVTPTAGASRGAAGERGFADVWWRGKFGWEYKRKDKYRDLVAAYRQLCQYREALENPPLLIVSDIARTEIHTNFTGTVKQVHAIALADMAEPLSLDLLRRVFTDPESFRPDVTAARVTEDVAKQFATIAKSLRQFEKGREPRDDDQTIAHRVAHFLMKCMFCLFAEDVDLLPKELFKKLVYRFKSDPAKLAERMTELFRLMQTGGEFGEHPIKYFNGGLFDEASALRLTAGDVGKLMEAAAHDWGSVEPAIFGTLFERSLDPNTRAQIGAHYTSRDDIMLVVEPVVIAALRREWEAVKADVEKLIEKRRAAKDKRAKTKADRAVEDELGGFVQRLSTVRILDPACGSGNFLYVAIQQLLQLEKEVITFAARSDVLGGGFFPKVRPTQLHGIEINPYAAELAQVVIWIGYLQWMRDNGYIDGIRIPILEPLQTIECRDAILEFSPSPFKGEGRGEGEKQLAKPASWPDADFIIGNPPFLGGGYLRQELGDKYTDTMFATFDLPNFSDLCCYWFELARKALDRNPDLRVGLLATQGIRGETNRNVIERIKDSGDVFCAWSDREWVLEGAAVHVSIIAFDSGRETQRMLDAVAVTEINADLTAGIDLTKARELPENVDVQFEGDKKGAAFEVRFAQIRPILASPHLSNGSVLEACRPWFNGSDVNQRPRGMWIVDFGSDMSLEEASRFEAPFAYVKEHVAPVYEEARKEWWLHERARPKMRNTLEPLSRFLVTVRHAPHRLFSWKEPSALPDSAVVCFARTDDYFFGAMQSSIHVLWAKRKGTQVREKESGDRYLGSCFETFSLPWPPGKEPSKHEAYRRIAKAAKELNEQRERWLNPPEWIAPIAEAVDHDDDFADVPEEARALIRHSAIMARAAKDPKLKKRTLTNLYNERPMWLKLAHEQLDRAVLAAYAATDPGGEWSEEWARLWVDTGAGQPLPAGHELADLRKETDQRVLANLLRINLQRATKG